MTAQTVTLTDFLLARIAEDELLAASAVQPNLNQHLVGHYDECDWWGDMPGYCTCSASDRRLAECKAKRQILRELAAGDRDGNVSTIAGLTIAVIYLANTYADHPDFRETWRAS